MELVEELGDLVVDVLASVVGNCSEHGIAEWPAESAPDLAKLEKATVLRLADDEVHFRVRVDHDTTFVLYAEKGGQCVAARLTVRTLRVVHFPSPPRNGGERCHDCDSIGLTLGVCEGGADRAVSPWYAPLANGVGHPISESLWPWTQPVQTAGKTLKL